MILFWWIGEEWGGGGGCHGAFICLLYSLLNRNENFLLWRFTSSISKIIWQTWITFDLQISAAVCWKIFIWFQFEPIGLWDVEASTYSRQSSYRWRWGWQPYAPPPLTPRKISKNNERTTVIFQNKCTRSVINNIVTCLEQALPW
jgi:hypothetical protein